MKFYFWKAPKCYVNKYINFAGNEQNNYGGMSISLWSECRKRSPRAVDERFHEYTTV